MKFFPSKAHPCIWLRKAPNLRCYEYIAVYVDDLCIAAESPSEMIQIFKSKYHLKVKGHGKLTYHLGADYFEDPDGTFVSQPKKYIVGSPQVSFLMCTLEIPQKIAVQVLCS